MRKRECVSRSFLVNQLRKNAEGILTHRKALKLVNVIVDSILSELMEDRAVSVKNFGTINPYVKKGQWGYDFGAPCKKMRPAKRSLKFHPHENFISLKNQRRDYFLAKNAEKEGR